MCMNDLKSFCYFNNINKENIGTYNSTIKNSYKF